MLNQYLSVVRFGQKELAALKTLDVMEKSKSWDFITRQGAKVKKRWINEAKKNNLTIQTLGLDSLATFTIKK